MTAEQLLDIARAEIGVTELPAGSNNVKYNTWFYGHEVKGAAYPWCMVWVEWVFHTAGTPLIPLTASCGCFVSQHNIIKSGFKPGDIAFMDFDQNRGNGIDHVGIIESLDNGITTIEGNTSLSSNDNGGAVMRRTNRGKYIVGVYRPDYEEEEMTDKQIYDANKSYADGLDESAWSKDEGAFEQAHELDVMDGTRPGAPVTREELAAILDRLGLLK